MPLFLLLSGALDTVNAVYVNKKQAVDFYQSAGLQLPLEGRRFNDLFGSSIKTDVDFVKAKLENPEQYFAEEQQEEQARALDDLKQEVRDALPGARDARDDGNRLFFIMPNGAKVEVQLSPSIDVSDTEASRDAVRGSASCGRRSRIWRLVCCGCCAGRTRIVACEGNPNSGEFEIGTARFYDIINYMP